MKCYCLLMSTCSCLCTLIECMFGHICMNNRDRLMHQGCCYSFYIGIRLLTWYHAGNYASLVQTCYVLQTASILLCTLVDWSYSNICIYSMTRLYVLKLVCSITCSKYQNMVDLHLLYHQNLFLR